MEELLMTKTLELAIADNNIQLLMMHTKRQPIYFQ
jgi:hypothetical protein